MQEETRMAVAPATHEDERSREWKKTWRKFAKNRGAVIGAAIMLVIVIIAIFAPVFAPYHPIKDQDIGRALQPPSRQFLFGTDVQGRDVLSRIIYGSRISLTVGLVVQAISLTIGTTLGLLAGFYGGRVDELINGLTNIMFAFPVLLFAIAIMAVLGPSLFNVFIALGLVGWPTICRLVRSETLSLREREFVEAARALGLSDLRTMVRHILPNTLGPIIVVGTLGVANAILAEASLSFLGLGTQPPTPSWGAMLSRGRDYIWSAPWITIFPGLAIFVTILGLNLLGDGLRDIFDPRLRE